MAAESNDTGFLGIAWGATFKVFTVPIGDHLAEDDPRVLLFDWEAAYEAVLASGVDIVNASYAHTVSATPLHYLMRFSRNYRGEVPGHEVVDE